MKYFKCHYHVPTASETWIEYDVPTWEEKDYAKKVHNWTELDLVKIKVAGMPVHWKLFNCVFILFPKTWLWSATAKMGISFLMESSGITDLFLNCMALTFVLSIDEMIVHSHSLSSITTIMNKLESFRLYDLEEDENHTDQQVLELYEAEHLKGARVNYYMLFPWRLCIQVGLTIYFLHTYYAERCVYGEDDTYVSKPVHYPMTPYLSTLDFLLGTLDLEKAETQKEPFWTMPPEH